MRTISKKEQNLVIFGVTIGSILEWYEAYLYIFWAPIFADLFFNRNSELEELQGSFLIFWVGFLARPLGGIFFGRIGDTLGRKKSFILSIVMTAIPTFLISLLPTHAQIGIFAPMLLGMLRFAQAFPSGGEQPGAFCYLYESAGPDNKRYLTSWGAVGNQIGIILSMVECYYLEQWLSKEELMAWGWRLSFGIGGVIGLLGFYLRSKLHETPVFKELHHNVQKSQKSLFETISIGLNSTFLNTLATKIQSLKTKTIHSTTDQKNQEILVQKIKNSTPIPPESSSLKKLPSLSLKIRENAKSTLSTQIATTSISNIFRKYKNEIFLGIGFCMLDAIGFYLISSVFPSYFATVNSSEYSTNVLIAIVTTIASTIPLPLFGILGDKVNNKFLMLLCSLSILVLLLPIYLSLSYSNLYWAISLYAISIMLFTCITALIPYLLCNLFPSEIRFTGVGISYNIVDGILGGLTPMIALSLFSLSGNPLSFLWLVVLSAIISSISYLKIKDRKN